MIIAAILGIAALYTWYPHVLPGYTPPTEEAYDVEPDPPVVMDPPNDAKPATPEPPRKFVGEAENTGTPPAGATSSKSAAAKEETAEEVTVERPAETQQDGAAQSVPATDQKNTEVEVQSETRGIVTEEDPSGIPEGAMDGTGR